MFACVGTRGRVKALEESAVQAERLITAAISAFVSHVNSSHPAGGGAELNLALADTLGNSLRTFCYWLNPLIRFKHTGRFPFQKGRCHAEGAR